VNPMQMDRHCLLNGCQLAYAGRMLGEAQAMLEQAMTEKRQAMSGALWCDLGEHAFSSKDRKRAGYKIQTVDEETGQPVEDELTACGPHAAERQVQLTRKTALPAGADQQLYTEFLEWKSGQRPAEPQP